MKFLSFSQALRSLQRKKRQINRQINKKAFFLVSMISFWPSRIMRTLGMRWDQRNQSACYTVFIGYKWNPFHSYLVSQILNKFVCSGLEKQIRVDICISKQTDGLSRWQPERSSNAEENWATGSPSSENELPYTPTVDWGYATVEI